MLRANRFIRWLRLIPLDIQSPQHVLIGKNEVQGRFLCFLMEQWDGIRENFIPPPFVWIQNPARIFAG